VVLTQPELRERLAAGGTLVLALEDEPSALAAEPATAPRRRAAPESLAYVLFTSGSTGTPKAVMIPHRAAVNHMLWMQDEFPLTAADRVLQKTAFTFDASVWELFAPLCAGAGLVMARPGGQRDPDYLAQVIAEQGITVLQLVPSQLRSLLDEGTLQGAACLRRVFCGGEALELDLAARFLAQMEAPLINLYGPAEATIEVTSWRCDAGDGRRSVPLGRPIANVEIRVLDDRLRLVPLGARGELYAGGLAPGRGYLGRPELTAERFLPDPFATLPGSRLYRSGDLAAVQPDLTIEYFGRADHQVKVRGFRIELGEVEATLARHPAVREAAVAVFEAAPGDRFLAGYYTTVRGQATTPAELRELLLAKLPDYMVPASLVELPAMPLTPSGKIDRRALPAPVAASDLEAPRGPGEQLMSELWAEVLNVDRVGIHSSFFEIGGHSLIATRLISRIRQVFQVELPLRSIFESPTVAGLLRQVEAVARSGAGLETPPIQPVPRGGEELPLSFAQQRLWFLDQLQPASPVYNIAEALGVEGSLDVRALASAFSEICRRHESLRTSFPVRDGRPAQAIAPPAPLPLPVVDLGSLPAAVRPAAAKRLAAAEALRPFRLECGPLLRVTLLRLAPAEHQVLVTMHHIASDGWSLQILVREVAALYRAAASGLPSPLPELPVQYADFAHWQRHWLRGEILARHVDYWRRQLADAQAVLDLPTDRQRPAALSLRGARVAVPLPAELTAAMAALARARRVTLFMALLAGFQALMHRYSGQQDVLVGSPVANRTRGEIEGLIGFFVNTLVLRLGFQGDPSGEELVERVREAVLGAIAHQDLPFEKLVEELQPQRAASHTPLFQVMFALENAPREVVVTPRLGLFPLGGDTATAKFDLTLNLAETPQGLVAALEYSTDLFDRASAWRMLAHFTAWLTGLAAQPARPVGEISLLTAAERFQLLTGWNDTELRRDEEATLHGLFAAQAAASPDALAAVFETRSLTYRELDRHANCLAHRLRALGVGPEVLVALSLPRSLELMVALLGVLKAGGAYLPLDPSYPAERLAGMMEDARATVVIHLPGDAEVPAAAGTRRVALAPPEPAAHLGKDGDEAPRTGVLADNPAYVIFTSGSTGRPKGAMNTHRAICNRLLWMQEALPLEPGDRVLQKSPLGFDVSVWELFWPLVAGGCVVLARPEGHLDPLYIADTMAEQRIAVVHFVPSMLRIFLEQEELERCVWLRWVICGGEAVPVDLAARCIARLPARFYDLYGPTEAAIDVTSWGYRPEEPGPAAGAGSVPIGRPISNARLYVVDRELRPVPVGVAGELYLAGVAPARGYVYQPALTAERFLPDPWSGVAGARAYRTGDLVRYLADGAVEFLGRIDNQVKVHGFRMELGEVEAVLASHPGVQAAAAVVVRGAAGDARLVGYVVPRAAAATPGTDGPSADELGRHLRLRLPEPMVPVTFVTLAAMPLTLSGKIDRRALPSPRQTLTGSPAEPVLPRTAAEATLARIWSEVLRLEQVAVHDNFFEIGGDSILSIQIVARASAAGLHITPRQMFQHQTVAELAAVAATAPRVHLEQEPVTGEAPLLPIQHWFFSLDLDVPEHFNQSLLLRPLRALPPARLYAALGALVAHHDALRLRFRRGDDGWRQLFAPPAGGAPLVRVDLSGLPEARTTVAVEQAAAALQLGFDLCQGPLVRVAHLDLAGTDSRLLFCVHHLLIDGVSWRILLDDLATAAAQLERGEPVHLPAKTTSLKRWAARLAEHVAAGGLRHQAAYWLAALPAAVRRLPADWSDGADSVAGAETLTVTLDADETRALLREVPRAYSSHVEEALLTGLAQGLAAWTGSVTALVDLEGHGREEIFAEVDLSRTVGWFTSLYPVALDLAGCASPGDALKRVKEQLRRVPDRGLGYGMLRYLAPRGSEPPPLAACPRPEVVFNYLGQIDQALDPSSPFGGAAEHVAGLRHPRQHRQHRLEVTAGVSGGRLWLSWTYGRQVFRRATVERLADAVTAALRALIDHCREAGAGGFTPSDFPLARIEQAVLDRWAAAGRPLEDLYALSPLQEGLLYHALSAPGSDAYFQQLSCTLRADLDRMAFDRAWREVIDLHPALRTSFAWREVDPPLQVVESGVELPVEALDWSDLPPAVQQERLRSLRLADRERGFDLARAPLMRLCLVRLAADTYELVWSFHHLLFDGWSLPRVVRQVFTAYAELRSGGALRLPRPCPYRDYIAWLMQQDQEAAEQFWRREMAGWQGPTSLGSRAAAPAPREDSEPDWRVLDTELSAAHSAALAALARRSQVSLNTVIQGAWAVLLSRYSGEREVLFGVTSSGRSAPVPGIEEMVGVFINTLPLRVEVTPMAQLAGWLRALQARQAEARQFEYCSLADIQTWAGSAAGEALFETLLIFENYPVGESLHETPGALEVLEVDIAERTTYPLTLLCSPGERMPLRLAGDPCRFERVELRRSLEHLCTLLAGMTEDAEGRRLAELPLLTAAERQQLLVAWNDTERRRDPGVTLHGRFAMRAAACPDALAAVCEGQSLTCHELDRQANRLAHRLRSLGVGPEVVVAVSLPRSLELVVGLLGVLKAGGAYLPLDPAYPRERQAAMVEDARAAVLLHLPDDAAAAAWQGLLKVAVEAAAAEVDGGLAPPADEALADNAAYVIFTSGSTGRPKGAVNTHRAICNVLDWMQETYGLEPGERVLQKTPIGFDVSVWELFWPLLAGGCLVLARPGGHLDSSYLIDTIVAQQVTTVHFVPAMLRAFLDEERVERCSGLRRVISIGEALPLDLAARCTARLAGSLHNLYGPTEAAVQVTAWAHQPDAGSAPGGAGAAATVPIGRPISNTRLYVVDRELWPVPAGAAGELCIAGVALARGYAHQPALTAERFIPEPWSGGCGERAYRTGDLVRYLADGALEFLGRIDSQVKVHGVRIELGEIEAALVSHPEVQAAAVVARSAAGETPLVGYVVPRAGAAPSPAELGRHLRRWLPEAMVPGAYVILTALPLTASGKLDRRALPSPESEVVNEETRSAAPRDLIAGVVAAIWCEVLGLPQVDERADFFALGGHSLTATRVISRLRKSLNVELPLRDLFEYPTVAALAARIEQARRSHGRRVEPPVRPAPRNQELPLSFAQERLWFIDQFEPGSPAYNLPAELRLRGALQVPHLAAALREVVRRHEVLRTRFPSLAGRPVQVVAPPGEPALPLADLSALPPARRAAEGQRQAAQEMWRPFDLTHGPVLRALLVRLGEDDHLLVVNQHHIASDGWSMGVLIGEVSQLYAAAREGRPSPLPELVFQYADLAVWQREWLRGEVLAAEIDYWRQRLAGAPELLALPTDRPRPAVVTYHGDELPLALSPRLTERLRALGQAEGATLFMTLIAGLQALLSRYSGQQDLIVSTTVAGRNRVEAEPLIGVFVNFLLLRADLASDPNFRALLAQGRETALEAHAHQDLPFERLVEELLPQRSMGHTPLFQVVCNLLNLPVQSIDSSDLTLIPMVERTRTAKFELVLDLVEGRGGVGGRLEYNTDLFDSTTAARLAAHFTALLEGAVADPWRRLIEVPLLAESERAQTLQEWNDTAEPLDPEEAGATIHSLFERQVKRAGSSIAVVAPGETLDYAELDRRANQLARQLRALGVCRGTLVGIYLRRSARLVMAPLAVLKAGGAYVPLEPAWPAERVRWIVRELGLSLLVTEASCLDPLSAGAIFEARPADLLVLDAAGAGGRDARAAGCMREDGTRLWWEEDRAALSGEALDAAGAGPEDLAYLIFTSGSTGRPKGVLVRHAPVVNLIGWIGRNFGIGPADRVLFITALSFDLSVYDIFGVLAAGGSVRVASDAEVGDPEALARALRDEPVTFWDSAPAALQQVVPFLGTAGSGAGRTRLRLAFLSGDWIPLTLAERLRAECGEEVEVVGLGGATEAVVWSNFYRIGDALPGWTSVPYGRPIANARYHVLDRPGEPCPIGVAGDLFIGGKCLAAGYGGEAALTAERFLPDPFAPEPGGRLYRTGDRARYRADGHLEFLGRLDSQIKIRGFRIELGEIEAVLAQHPAVREAVALAPADASGNRSLTVCAVLEPATAATATELREHLARKLPDPMVPARVTLLAALPLTANGKLDRAALSRLALAAEPRRDRARGGLVPPRTPLEEVLASVWSEVLHREEIAVDDDFFELGGHSLLATQVVSRLRGALGAEVPVRLVFELPTIAAQAARLAEGRRSHLGAAPPISPAAPGQQAAAPLSYAQQRLWLIDQLEPGSPAYNMFWGLRLSGDLHLAALHASLAEVVARHASLRTTFVDVEGRPLQVVAPPGPPGATPLPVIDLSGLPEERREAAGAELAGGFAGWPFDLRQGPLLRLALLRLDASRHLGFFMLHHIVGDAWSMGILVAEVAALYAAALQGRASPLPALEIQYPDFAQWQRRWLDGPVRDTLLGYWRRKLAGGEPPQLAPDYPRLPAASHRGGRYDCALSREVSARLGALARGEHATVFMVLVAALQGLLHRSVGQDRVWVGIDIANRNQRQTEGLIGFLLNQLVIATDLSGDPSFRGLLARVREVMLEAYDHQDLPFDLLVEELQPARHPGRTPLLQVKVAHQNAPLDQAAFPGLAISNLHLVELPARFDLTLLTFQGEGGIEISWIYRADLFAADTIRRLADQYVALLEGAAADPDTRLAGLDLLSETEKQRRAADKEAREEKVAGKLKTVRPKPVARRLS
jgi:amino acid adenylation domain-containing protein/non-ribosomal peptide synthase protein (TIGR01720 family)